MANIRIRTCLVLAILFLAGTACDSGGSTTANSNGGPASGSRTKTDPGQRIVEIPAEFAVIVGEATIIPTKTKMSEVIAALGEPTQRLPNTTENAQSALQGFYIWDCHVFKRMQLVWEREGGTRIEVNCILHDGDKDGIVYNVKATGEAGASLGDGTMLGGDFRPLLDALLPHLDAGATIPPRQRDQWAPDLPPYFAASVGLPQPLPGELTYRPGMEPSDYDRQREGFYEISKIDGRALPVSISWYQRDLISIQKADRKNAKNRNWLLCRPTWKIGVSPEPRRITAIELDVNLWSGSWLSELQEAKNKRWNNMKRDKKYGTQYRDFFLWAENG